ncbi:MAG: preprotein translocase subunit SecE [Dehalococcoidales bacterium]|nr:preprotein translocase subunit SecE [Dehalococcoidales bacterium]
MTQPGVSKRRGFRLFRYFSEIISELKKVVWLKPREVFYLTGIVLAVVIVTALVLGVLDYGFAKLFIGR